MALSELNLTTNKNLVSLQSETLRQSESGLVLKANLLMPDGSPYDLSGGKTVTFNEHKQNDKYVVDTNVTIVDAAHGSISYKLHAQCYAATGVGWFEIINAGGGDVVDSTENFRMSVLDAANASIYNSNYIRKLDDLRDQMQTLVDGADGKLKEQLQDAQASLNSQLDTMKQAYSDQSKQFQQSFASDENAREQKLSDAIKANQADWGQQKAAIQTAAHKQISDNQSSWDKQKQSLLDDWQKTQKGFSDSLATLQSKVNVLNAAVAQLNKTDLPNAQQKMDALEAEIKKAEQTFSQVDFSKFVTDTELAAKLASKANTADVYTKSELDPKLAEAGKVKTVSLNGGNKVAPDSAGNIDLSAPQPDLTGYAKTTDVNGQFTTVNNQIKELQSQQSTFTPITQAEYDALPEDEKANGMYAIGDSN